MATLTYSYADSTVVVGPISVYAEPHAYDLCGSHADAVRAPRSWELLRLDYSSPEESEDDLLALADAVRETHRGPAATAPARQAPRPLSAPEAGSGVSRGHLRLLRD